jgi:hypothetical protein
MEPITAIAGAGAVLGSGYLGYRGQSNANRTNMDIAKKQMAFQKYMSNSAHRRAVYDMRAAGLNPILAAGKPASSPAGATTQVTSAIGAGVNTAMAAARAIEEVKNLKETNKLLKMQTQKTWSDARKSQYEGDILEARVPWANAKEEMMSDVSKWIRSLWQGATAQNTGKNVMQSKKNIEHHSKKTMNVKQPTFLQFLRGLID